jgi:fatty acid-binding protein DegV
MLAKMAERVGTDAPVNLAVIHAEAPDEARETLDQAKRIFQCNETFVDDLAISLAVHFGPGTVGVVAYRVS